MISQATCQGKQPSLHTNILYATMLWSYKSQIMNRYHTPDLLGMWGLSISALLLGCSAEI